MLASYYKTPGPAIPFITQQLARDIAKFSKFKNGKGPNNVEVKYNNDIVLCFFDGFLTKAEESIVQSGFPESVAFNRVIYINYSINEIEEIFLKYLNKKIKHLFPCYLPQKNLASWTIVLQ